MFVRSIVLEIENWNCVLFKESVAEHKRRGMMVKQLVKIVTSSNIRRKRKFVQFLEAISTDFEHVKDQLVKVFNDAGLNDYITGQFPKVRIKSCME